MSQVDVSPRYGDGNAERYLGQSLREFTHVRVFGKTRQRSAIEVHAEFKASSERLGRGMDLYAAHSVGEASDLRRCLAPGGAFEALLELRASGAVLAIGASAHGHDAPRRLLDALRAIDLDAVMFPVNPVLWSRPSYRADAEALLAACRIRGIGVLAIKSFAWTKRSRPRQSGSTWYEPVATGQQMERVLAFSLAQSPVATVCTPSDPELLQHVIEAGRVVDEGGTPDFAFDIADVESPFEGWIESTDHRRVHHG